MPAHLSDEKRNHIVEVGTEIYSAYLLLDMVSSNYYVSQSDTFDLDNQKISLNEYIISLIKKDTIDSLIKKDTIDADFDLGGRKCHISVLEEKGDNPEISSWNVSITSAEETQPTALRPINQHQPDDLLNFCKKYPLTISRDKTGDYKFGATLNVNGKEVKLGGADKLDLYQLHISNLYTMLTRLMDKEANLNMLVAMATGSGKSFTQALWFLVQYLADNPCFFAAPRENLVAQLKRDFDRLLPSNITQQLTVFTANDPIATHDAPKWGIMSHEKLLNDHWDFLQDERAQDNGMLLCVDEEHISSQEELFSKRIAILADHYPTMFLSATPSEKAYQISGGQPIASLSRKEKEELGISKAAVSKQASTRGTIDKSRKEKPLSAFQSLIMRFVDSIEDERFSTAHEYVDLSETTVTHKPSTDPFYAKPKAPKQSEVRRFIRWNIAAPIGEKSLILTGAHDPVINMNLLRNGESENAYKEGNRVFRDNVYDFFQLGPNLDSVCSENYKKAKKALRLDLFLKPLEENFPEFKKDQLSHFVEKNVDFSETNEYMEIRVLHGLIENTLDYLLGYDSNHLDYMRFHHLDKLRDEVDKKLEGLCKGWNLDRDRIKTEVREKLLKDNLPYVVANEVAEAIYQVLYMLKHYNNKELIIDNWLLDKELHELFMDGCGAIATFIKKYKTIFMVNGLEKTATAIQSNRPFFSLNELEYAMDDESVKNNDALRHKLSPLEILDDTTSQAVYEPNYCPPDYSPAVVDILFRKGLIGAYITSERAIGFNDPNLHHVGMIIDSYGDQFNAPDHIIQGSGRNRGLNPARQPHFILTSESGTKPSFSPEKLEKKNYYPDFFEAKKSHHENITKHLGCKIAAEIKNYIEASILPDGTIQTEDFGKNLHDIILTEFEKVYKNNAFDFEKTKKIFKKVLADTYIALNAQSKKINHPHALPRFAKAVAGVFSLFSTIYYKLSIARHYFSFVKACRRLRNEIQAGGASLHEETYAHIIRNFSYKEHVTKGVSTKRFIGVLKEDVEKTMQYALEKNVFKYFKPDIQERLTDFFKKELSAYFIRFVGTEKEQIELLGLIESKTDWLEKHFPSIKNLQLNEDDIDKYFDIIKTDPEIYDYLKDNNLSVEKNRSQAIEAAFNEMKEEIPNAFLRGGPFEVSKVIVGKIDVLKFFLHPKDALFLAQHKNEISVTEETLKILMFFKNNQPKPEEIPGAIVTLLRSSLPDETIQVADASNCLALETYDIQNKSKEINSLFNSPPEKLFDMDSLYDLLAQSIDHYIKSPIFNEIINYLLGSFSSEHLETLLNAIYPEGDPSQEVPEEVKGEDPPVCALHHNDNKIKTQQLLDFRRDLKALSSKEIFKKYVSIDDFRDLENSDLVKILTYLTDIYNEVLACETYWHAITNKDDSNNNPKKPKLYSNSRYDGHAIWEKRGITESSDMIGVAKKMLFLRATQNSFDSLNKVEKLKNSNTVRVLEETARFFMQPLKKTINGSRLTAHRKCNPHQVGLFASATTLGSKMRTVKSLTDEEVRSSATEDYNAVQKMRRELSRRR